VTGEKKAAAEPAQVETVSSLAAPRTTYQETAQEIAQEGAQETAHRETASPNTATEAATGTVIRLADRAAEIEAPAGAAITARANEQVTVLAKPEKRKNARQRSQEKFAKSKSDQTAEPDQKAKPDQDDPAKDGTTPDMTATAKSKAGAKSADVLAANEARKERKAAAKAKASVKANVKAKPKAGAKVRNKAAGR
jgi:hypothetical protein